MALLPSWLSRGVNAFAVHSLFHSMNMLGMMRLPGHEHTRDLKVTRNIQYADEHGAFHRLDVYQPRRPGRYPAVMFIHGGGFKTMSKDTHWMMARAFARRGFVVFTINYRLGPGAKYPEPLQDVCQAYQWMVNHADEFGADLDRLVLCGESAGANLVMGLTLATTYQRTEPWARRVYELGVQPKVVLPACGILQVSDIERFRRTYNQPFYVMGMLRDASKAYMPSDVASSDTLMDPLLVVEQQQRAKRPLPALFAPVGSRDPLQSDSTRLVDAWQKLGGLARCTIYDGGVHSFMAFMWSKLARACWADMFAFLDEVLPQEHAPDRPLLLAS